MQNCPMSHQTRCNATGATKKSDAEAPLYL